MYIGINDHWYEIIISGMVTFERKLLSCERYERMTVSFDSSFGETLCKIEMKESKTETTLSNSERSFFKPEMNLQTALRKQRREEVMPPMTPESSVWVKRILKHERILLIQWQKKETMPRLLKRKRRIVPAAELVRSWTSSCNAEPNMRSYSAIMFSTSSSLVTDINSPFGSWYLTLISLSATPVSLKGLVWRAS